MWKGFSRDSLRNLGQKLRVPSKKVKTSSDAGTDLKIPTPGATGGDKPEPSASSTLSSHMMDKWKAQNILTWTNVSAQAKTYIPIITRAGYKAIISDSAQKATQQSSQKATEMAKQSTQHLSSYAQRASSHAKSVASEVAKHGKETMIEEAHTMKRDILRWLWWWSIAAIFVYGLATTIPGELLKYYYRNRNRTSDENDRTDRGKIKNTPMEEDNTAVVKRDNNSRSIFPWPFSTGEANDANQEKTEINNQSIFPKPNVFSQLSWPTWSQDASNDNDKKIDKEGYLERTKRLFSTSWSKDDKDLEKKDEGMMAKSKNYLQSKWSSWSGS